ncbi:MAG: hypothetical protein KF690_06005 [Bacteroidetes bacterium]|nr:hypothetical protein [Bacteroidota bacterium]
MKELVWMLIGTCMASIGMAQTQTPKPTFFQGKVVFDIRYDATTMGLHPMWGDSAVLSYGPKVLHFEFFPDTAQSTSSAYRRSLRHIWLLPDEKRICWQYALADTLHWAHGQDYRYTLYGMSLSLTADSLLGFATQSLLLMKRDPGLPLDLLMPVRYTFAPALSLPVGYFAPFTGSLWHIYSRKAKSVFLDYHVSFWEEGRFMHWHARRVEQEPAEPRLPSAEWPREYDPQTVVLY